MASFPPLSNTQVQGIVVLPILPNPPGCTVQDAMGHPTVLSSGSVVRRGEGNGVVMLTGAKTYFGRTTELVQQARPKLHIEAVVVKVVRWLFVIVGALLGVVVVLSLIRGAPLIEMIPLMLVMLMSAVPVALPVMFTVSMAGLIGCIPKRRARVALWARAGARFKVFWGRLTSDDCQCTYVTRSVGS